MEKLKPHYDLTGLKKLLSKQATRHVTRVARRGAVDLGYMDDEAMVSVIHKLCSGHFYKSMTSNQNQRLWQDVYKFKDEENKLYIKLQLSIDGNQAVLLQFKRDEGED